MIRQIRLCRCSIIITNLYLQALVSSIVCIVANTQPQMQPTRTADKDPPHHPVVCGLAADLWRTTRTTLTGFLEQSPVLLGCDSHQSYWSLRHLHIVHQLLRWKVLTLLFCFFLKIITFINDCFSFSHPHIHPRAHFFCFPGVIFMVSYKRFLNKVSSDFCLCSTVCSFSYLFYCFLV